MCQKFFDSESGVLRSVFSRFARFKCLTSKNSPAEKSDFQMTTFAEPFLFNFFFSGKKKLIVLFLEMFNDEKIYFFLKYKFGFRTENSSFNKSVHSKHKWCHWTTQNRSCWILNCLGKEPRIHNNQHNVPSNYCHQNNEQWFEYCRYRR